MNWPVIGVFVLINLLVLANAVLHDPRIGYDADDHLKNVLIWAQGRFPTPEESHEYFSAPLPYCGPALVKALTRFPLMVAFKTGQLLQVLVSTGTLFFLLKTAKLLNRQGSFRLGALVCIGILPVYYKTFAFVRGEPYILFFGMVMTFTLLSMCKLRRYTVAGAVVLGVCMGFCALSRQWGFFLFPATCLLLAWQWWRQPDERRAIMRTLVVALTCLALVGGWFYVALTLKYNTPGAFNRTPETTFSLANQPASFYFSLSPTSMLTQPVRPYLANQLIPILYADMWGDYWLYFTIYGRQAGMKQFASGAYMYYQLGMFKDGIPEGFVTNYTSAQAYLGRINAVSLLPTVLLFASVVLGFWRMLTGGHTDNVLNRLNPKTATDPANKINPPGLEPRAVYGFLLLSIGVTLVGYMWFLISFPIPDKGDTIKTSYVLQIFPYVALLGAIALERLRMRFPGLHRWLLITLGLIFLHNLGAIITRYNMLKLLLS